MSRIVLAIRQLRRGNFKFPWLLLTNALYGITHIYCLQCGRRKGLSTHSRCYTCQLANLMHALEEEL